MKNRLKLICGVLGIVLMAMMLSSFTEIQSSKKYDSIIIIQVADLNGEQYSRISKMISAEPNVYIEYSCLWSGVMVVKINNSDFSKKGDVQMYMNRLIGSEVESARIKYIHHYTEQTMGDNKC
jgi:hypothetical protein